jgi:hypothetical protein
VDDRERLLRRLYEAFNARDIDRVIAAMHPEVDWPNAMEGGRVHGVEAVREYWRRQFDVIDPRLEIEAVETFEGGATVAVRQIVRDLDENLVDDSRRRHVYTLEDGLVARMEIEQD